MVEVRLRNIGVPPIRGVRGPISGVDELVGVPGGDDARVDDGLPSGLGAPVGWVRRSTPMKVVAQP